MKKYYNSPELEVVRYTLTDVLSVSLVDTLPTQDGGGDDLPGEDDGLGGDL